MEDGPDPGTSRAPEWYAGLAVSPAAFSHELSEMQLSLQRANNASKDTANQQTEQVAQQRG
jgi:hypothetical protein